MRNNRRPQTRAQEQAPSLAWTLCHFAALALALLSLALESR